MRNNCRCGAPLIEINGYRGGPVKGCELLSYCPLTVKSYLKGALAGYRHGSSLSAKNISLLISHGLLKEPTKRMREATPADLDFSPWTHYEIDLWDKREQYLKTGAPGWMRQLYCHRFKPSIVALLSAEVSYEET